MSYYRDNFRSFLRDLLNTCNWQETFLFSFLNERNIRCLLFQHSKTVESPVFLESIRFNHWKVEPFNFKGTVVC